MVLIAWRMALVHSGVPHCTRACQVSQTDSSNISVTVWLRVLFLRTRRPDTRLWKRLALLWPWSVLANPTRSRKVLRTASFVWTGALLSGFSKWRGLFWLWFTSVYRHIQRIFGNFQHETWTKTIHADSADMTEMVTYWRLCCWSFLSSGRWVPV